MAHNQQSALDSQCAKARPWVRRFVEEYQDGRPWGYAVFEDPTVDDEDMEECMCRIDNMLWAAKDAVFGRDHAEFPSFKWEVLDWPERSEDEHGGEHEKGNAPTQPYEPASKLDLGEVTETEVTKGDAQGLVEEGGDSAEEAEHDEAGSGHDQEGQEDDEDDADIETVRDLDKLRAHFKWVRDRAKKRRRAHESLDSDRSGIPNGVLRNVFLVIDQDVVDGIVVNSPIADNAWIWAIDPDYTGDVASMAKNGLKDEYYGYLRVRVQQLVNNFWNARHFHDEEQPFPTLWAAAQQSHQRAFVSVDPAEAQMISGGMLVGSALTD